MKFDRIPIGKFSLMTHLTQKALRLYDKKGLLVPEAKDAFTNYRCYTYDQIERGVKIRTLSWMGFSLNEIATLLDAEEKSDSATISVLMQKRCAHTEKEILRLQKVQQVLLRQKDTLELYSMSVSEPAIREVPQMRVLSKKEIGSYEVTIGKLIGELFGFIGSQNNPRNDLKVTGPCMFICHDEEYRETGANIEVALPVSGSISTDDFEVELLTLPAATVVSVIHKGPYEEVGVAYTRLFEYINNNDLKAAGPSRSLYLNDPNEVPEEEFLTEVQIPVTPL
ncbi:MerR family transcriptional regulator [Methanolobus profundi]|uniref:Effector-binding domain-containing protein n=1 Tax=Methanolobus profundi TaxID=487685 RepID=A0A1I4R410_9EURY|nr:GyrI-like domain-containing protein [Methanolobus profundi]SFM47032.1 effector-binding domain-containing protein [Methanolobus profundi]